MDKTKVHVNQDNIIFKTLIKLDDGVSQQWNEFPIETTFQRWIMLNTCYETDVKKLSSDQLVEAIEAADDLGLTEQINENTPSIMDDLLLKAKKVLRFEDFKDKKLNASELQDLYIQKSRSRLDYQLASIIESKTIYGDFLRGPEPLAATICFFIIRCIAKETKTSLFYFSSFFIAISNFSLISCLWLSYQFFKEIYDASAIEATNRNGDEMIKDLQKTRQVNNNVHLKYSNVNYKNQNATKN